MNRLKALTEKIEDFNARAKAHKVAGDMLDEDRQQIVADALRTCGIRFKKASGMLAKIKTELEDPVPDAADDEEPQGEDQET